MWYQFILENLHFALNLTAALAFFTVFWLYFDAWTARHSLKEMARWLGFLFLSISFVVSAIYVETTIVSVPFLPQSIHTLLLAATRLMGYSFIILSLVIDPLIPKPSKNHEAHSVAVPLLGMPITISFSFLYPILAGFAGFLYLRRATIGLENHLKPVALTFFILSISELLSLGYLLQGSTNTTIYNFTAPFGILWIAQQVILLLSIFVLRQWIFGYLLKRFQSQLFIIFTTSIVVIFLITTISFSALLLKNLETDSLSHLSTDVNILNYTVESKKGETVSDAQLVAQNPQVQKAVEEGERKTLKDIASVLLLAKKQSTLTILSSTGVVMARGEDPERVGDSLSDDPIVQKALAGESVSSVLTKDGVVAPTVTIRSAVPISIAGKTSGVVVVETDIDNAFVDGVKSATKLDASVYADNIRSATTYIAADGRSRSLGVKEESPVIKKTVLNLGHEFVGQVNILNTPYLAAFTPLKDVNNISVGMLFVGRPQVELLVAAGKSIEMTFVVSVILLILSIVPAYFVSKYMASQLDNKD
jgi:hypothetical protein